MPTGIRPARTRVSQGQYLSFKPANKWVFYWCAEDIYPILLDMPPLSAQEAANTERCWRDAQLAGGVMPVFDLMPMSYCVIGVVVFLAVLVGASTALEQWLSASEQTHYRRR